MTFELTTLGEYAKIQGGYAYKSSDFFESGTYPVLKIKNVRFGYVDYSDASSIEDELSEETTDWSTNEGDILISMTGSGPNAPQSLVGRVARVWKNEPKAWINQRVGRVVNKDADLIHSDFLFYLLSSRRSQEYLVSNSSGSANQANISGKIIESLPCPRVTYEQSVNVAKVLRDLDEKIVLNRQTNHTLEQMAQAIFKCWFVDFEPVRGKAHVKGLGGTRHQCEMAAQAVIVGALSLSAITDETDLSTLDQNLTNALQVIWAKQTDEQKATLAETATHFPDGLVDSELGEIPVGWEVDVLSSIASNIRNGVHPSVIDTEIPYIGLEHIEKKQVYIDRWGQAGDVDSNKSQFEVGDMLFGKLRPYFHKVCFMPFSGISSTDILVIRAKSHAWHGYVQSQLFDEVFVEYANVRSTGTRMPRANWKDMANYKIVKPNRNIAAMFSDLVDSFNKKAFVNIASSQCMESMRDTLLPKLLSGELSVTDIDTIQAEAN